MISFRGQKYQICLHHQSGFEVVRLNLYLANLYSSAIEYQVAGHSFRVKDRTLQFMNIFPASTNQVVYRWDATLPTLMITKDLRKDYCSVGIFFCYLS